MHGSTNAVNSGAPFQLSNSGPVLSATSALTIERSLKYLAFHLASTADRQDDLISIGLRAIHYAHVTYEPAHGASIETFLIRCAHRAMLDFVRSELRQTGGWVSGDAPLGPDTQETLFDSLPDESVEGDPSHAFLLQQVKLAVLDLPQRQRDCIRLHYFADLDNAEIAEHLGVSRPRVTQLLKAGVKRLRTHLGFNVLEPKHSFN